MKKNIHVLDQPDGTERLRIKQHCRKISLRLISLRVSVVTLLLVACIGLDIGSLASHAYAKSACGVLFACPTPTPKPRPTSTPSPNPTPTPIPAPSPTPIQQPSPTAASGPVLAPTVTASVSPTAIATATPTKVAQKTPVPDPTRIPVTNNQKTGSDSHIAEQSGGNGFAQMLTIIGIILVCLFVALAIGLLIFRRMLLPPIKMKLPVSGVSSWTRTLPSDSLPGSESIDDMHEMQPAGHAVPAFASMDNDAGTFSGNFVPSSQRDTAGVASAGAETVSDLPASHSANPWYDIADDPFNT